MPFALRFIHDGLCSSPQGELLETIGAALRTASNAAACRRIGLPRWLLALLDYLAQAGPQARPLAGRVAQLLSALLSHSASPSDVRALLSAFSGKGSLQPAPTVDAGAVAPATATPSSSSTPAAGGREGVDQGGASERVGRGSWLPSLLLDVVRGVLAADLVSTHPRAFFSLDGGAAAADAAAAGAAAAPGDNAAQHPHHHQHHTVAESAATPQSLAAVMAAAAAASASAGGAGYVPGGLGGCGLALEPLAFPPACYTMMLWFRPEAVPSAAAAAVAAAGPSQQQQQQTHGTGAPPPASIGLWWFGAMGPAAGAAAAAAAASAAAAEAAAGLSGPARAAAVATASSAAMAAAAGAPGLAASLEDSSLVLRALGPPSVEAVRVPLPPGGATAMQARSLNGLRFTVRYNFTHR